MTCGAVGHANALPLHRGSQSRQPEALTLPTTEMQPQEPNANCCLGTCTHALCQASTGVGPGHPVQAPLATVFDAWSLGMSMLVTSVSSGLKFFLPTSGDF